MRTEHLNTHDGRMRKIIDYLYLRNFRRFSVVDYTKDTDGEIGRVLFATCNKTKTTLAFYVDKPLVDIIRKVSNHYEKWNLETNQHLKNDKLILCHFNNS